MLLLCELLVNKGLLNLTWMKKNYAENQRSGMRGSADCYRSPLIPSVRLSQASVLSRASHDNWFTSQKPSDTSTNAHSAVIEKKLVISKFFNWQENYQINVLGINAGVVNQQWFPYRWQPIYIFWGVKFQQSISKLDKHWSFDLFRLQVKNLIGFNSIKFNQWLAVKCIILCREVRELIKTFSKGSDERTFDGL